LFSKDNLKYFREEKNEYITVMSKEHPESKELIINPTAKEILYLCNGKRSYSEIVEIMLNKYDVKRKILENDIRKTLLFYSNLKIIEWLEGENPFIMNHCKVLSEKEELTAKLAHESDIRKILDFLQNYKETLNYYSPYINEGDYSELVLRSKLFSFSEEFFILEKKGVIQGCLGIQMPINQSFTAAAINIILCPENELEHLLKYSISILSKTSVCPITKIRFIARNENSKDDLIANIVIKCGFIYEGFFRKEIGDLDIKMYSFIY